MSKSKTAKLDRLRTRGKEFLQKSYQDYVPKPAKRVVGIIDRQGVRIRDKIREESPRGKELLKQVLRKTAHTALTPVRETFGGEEKSRKRRKR